MGIRSTPLSIAPATDISVQVEESLDILAGLINAASQEANLQDGQILLWGNRITRANEVLTRVKPEGRKSAETLLAQAREHHDFHTDKLAQTKEKLGKLVAHKEEMQQVFEQLKATEVQIELQKRIHGIEAGIPVEPLGDEKSDGYDAREQERTIHTVKALIDLRGKE